MSVVNTLFVTVTIESLACFIGILTSALRSDPTTGIIFTGELIFVTTFFGFCIFHVTHNGSA